MNLQPEEKENRSFCIKWISTRGCAFKAFLKKVNAGEKKGKRKLWMYRQTLPALSKKEKNPAFKYHPHQEQTCLSSVCTYIYICLLRFRRFSSPFLSRGGGNFRRASAESPQVKKHRAPGGVPSRLHSLILGRARLRQLSSGLHR